jgi:inorganic pyrophosphatase
MRSAVRASTWLIRISIQHRSIRLPLIISTLASAFAPPVLAQSTFDAVIEIPTGTSVKYEFDFCANRMRVDRFVQMPVVYPVNYGFIPATLKNDGDPLDVVVYTREAIMSGAIVGFRPIGVLRMYDGGLADEKIIGVPTSKVDASYDSVRSIDDLGLAHKQRLENFFRVYKQVSDGTSPVELRGFGNAAEAERIVQAARQLASERGAPEARTRCPK